MAIDKNRTTRKYRASLVDASTHQRLWSIIFTRPAFIAAIISLIILLLVIFFLLVAFTPLRTFIPGYPDAQARRQAVQNAIRIDSLETQILQWELYTENLKKVVAGEEPLLLDSLILRRQETGREADSLFLARRDSLLRVRVTEAEQFEVSGPRRELPIEAISFYTPLKGVVSQGFDLTLHPWVDVTAPTGTAVMAVLDGTVVFAGWEEADGYTLAIQHRGDILSIYKRNEKLLKKAGDTVKAGTPVALVGSSGSLTKGDHLRFELWYAGEAVDPTAYISF
ncbi:MAG: M23 family metallopeptidase [Bacteroidales bacterium]|nr:M23 family metallopeptidase [Bacteroidales bacterium]